MRLIKTLGGIAALTTMIATMFMGTTAVVGTTSASAFHFHAYCSLNEWLCSLNNRITLRGRWRWRHLGPPSVLFKGTVTEECTKSEGLGNEGAKEKEELADEGGMEFTLETLTFSECEPCTSVKSNTPIKPKIFMMSENEEESPNWLVTLKGLNITFSGCTFGTSCTFGSSELNLPLELEEKEVSMEPSSGVKLELKEGSGFFCGSTIQWFFRYSWVWRLHNAMEETIYPSLFI